MARIGKAWTVCRRDLQSLLDSPAAWRITAIGLAAGCLAVVFAWPETQPLGRLRPIPAFSWWAHVNLFVVSYIVTAFAAHVLPTVDAVPGHDWVSHAGVPPFAVIAGKLAAAWSIALLWTVVSFPVGALSIPLSPPGREAMAAISTLWLAWCLPLAAWGVWLQASVRAQGLRAVLTHGFLLVVIATIPFFARAGGPDASGVPWHPLQWTGILARGDALPPGTWNRLAAAYGVLALFGCCLAYFELAARRRPTSAPVSGEGS